jgi:hypothetical protein
MELNDLLSVDLQLSINHTWRNAKNELTKAKKEVIEWCRDEVLELSSQGHNLTEIADILHIKNVSTISRDLTFLIEQAKIISKNTLSKDFLKNMRNVWLD